MATLSSSIPNRSTTSQYTILLPSPNLTNKKGLNPFPTPPFQLPKRQVSQLTKRQHFLAPCSSTHVVGGGFPIDEFGAQTTTSSSDVKQEDQKWDPAQCEALLKGGEQVASVLQEMAKIVSFAHSHFRNLPGLTILWS